MNARFSFAVLRFDDQVLRIHPVLVQIDETRGNDQATRVDFLIGTRTNLVRRRNFCHLAVTQQNVHERVHARQRVNDPPTTD